MKCPDVEWRRSGNSRDVRDSSGGEYPRKCDNSYLAPAVDDNNGSRVIVMKDNI